MKRCALLALFAIAAFLAANTAAADCTTYTQVEWQATYWWDGEVTYLILNITEFMSCTVYPDDPQPVDPGGGGGDINTPPPMPVVTLLGVDTTNIYNPIVSFDVSSNDPNDPVTVVSFELDGQTADYVAYHGDTQYQFPLQGIPYFAEGNYILTGKACSGTGNCGVTSATMYRYTPSPATASTDMTATWYEEDEEHPIARFANYNHSLRQMYTTTTFSCPETGENSHVQTRDSLVTISGSDPMTLWTAGAVIDGSLSNVVYGIYDPSPSPLNCTFPTICDSKVGSRSDTFGYSLSVHEGLWSFVVDGWNAGFTGGSLDIWLTQ